jgi:succinate dehydrogenase/fumarate reductase flavoprotein subunit
MQVVRATFEIPRPTPIAPLRAAVRVLRGGRSVELVEATLEAAGAEVMAEAARPCRHRAGDRWFVDQTYVKVAGLWRQGLGIVRSCLDRP